VPGRGDEQEDRNPEIGLEVAPATPLAGEQQVRDGRAEKKTGAINPLVSRARAYGGHIQ